MKYLEKTGQFNANHHAYRERLGTATALIQIVDTLGEAIDNNEIGATMGIDKSAAFDCVDHALLLQKLKFYNLSQECIQWIESYLRGRTNYVVIGSKISDMYTIDYGVPQGSVLSPLLYLLYINDFPGVVEDNFCENRSHNVTETLFGDNCTDCGSLTLYADDGLYVTSSKSRNRNQDNIEDRFHRIKDYLNAHGLQINQGKTTLTEVMSSQKRAKINGIPPDLTATEMVKGKIQDKHIMDSQNFRILGINIKNNLSWGGSLGRW